MPQLSGLTSSTGTLRLSGGSDFTTGASLANSGVLRTGPGSSLTISGGFSNSGTVRTEIAGRPATGQYGLSQPAAPATLAGTFTPVVTDAAFTPVTGDVYDVVRYSSRSGAFAVHEGLVPFYGHVYATLEQARCCG